MEDRPLPPCERFNLHGRVIVVTGGAGFLGRQHCMAIAAAGGTPVIVDVDRARADVLLGELRARYDVPATAWIVDITSDDAVRRNCADVRTRYGRIHGLVNNAANNPKVEDGQAAFTRLEAFPLDVWQQDVAVGLTGAFLAAKHYGAAIAEDGGGTIVNIASDLALIAPDQRLYRDPSAPGDAQPVKPVSYSVVKTGLVGLTRYLATYWCDQNVRCNALCPGGVENGQDPGFLREVGTRIPLGRLARPDEYQGPLVFLLSDASSYVTGAVIAADGGRSAW